MKYFKLFTVIILLFLAGVASADTATATQTATPTLTPSGCGASSTDAFTRTNSSTLGYADTGQHWSQTSNYVGIHSNSAMMLDTGSDNCYINTLETDGTASLTITAINTGNAKIGVIVRFVDTSNMWQFVANTINGTYYLREEKSGTWLAPVGVTSRMPLVGDVMKVVAVGSSLQGYVGNTLVSSATDNDFTSTGTAQGFYISDNNINLTSVNMWYWVAQTGCTATMTQTPTATYTFTRTPTITITGTFTTTPTITLTGTVTLTKTQTLTTTQTMTSTYTNTQTKTITQTVTQSNTFTPTPNSSDPVLGAGIIRLVDPLSGNIKNGKCDPYGDMLFSSGVAVDENGVYHTLTTVANVFGGYAYTHLTAVAGIAGQSIRVVHYSWSSQTTSDINWQDNLGNRLSLTVYSCIPGLLYGSNASGNTWLYSTPAGSPLFLHSTATGITLSSEVTYYAK